MRFTLAVMLTGVALTVPGVARADVVDAATAGPVRSITYNVCGAHCPSAMKLGAWTAAIKKQIIAWDADAVMLQELCIGQWIAVRDALPGYRAVWGSTVLAADGCGQWGGTDHRFGLGVLVKTAEVERYVASLAVPDGREHRAVLCARGLVDGRTTLVCSTHLAQYVEPDNGSAELMRHVDGWAAGGPVILGGDFNANPDYPALDPVRAGLPGVGRFAEVDENDRDHFTKSCLDAGAAECRSGEPTGAVNGSPRKFDHIFVSTADFHTVRGDAVEPGLSDHLLLRGAASPEARQSGT
jgi:endonuclease/exonuclease/phosphatase family metal-dependent hydrolase